MKYDNSYLKKMQLLGEDVSREIWGESAISGQWDGGGSTQNPILPWLSMSMFGHSYSPEKILVKERELITISALISMGLAPEVRLHCIGALRNGWTQLELRDALLVSMYAAGMPRSINSFKVINEVLASLEQEIEVRESVRNECDLEDDIYQRGLTKAKAFLGSSYDTIVGTIEAFDSIAAKEFITDVFGMAMYKSFISDRMNSLLMIANYVCTGNTEFLKLFIPVAINNGATEEEVRAVIYQMIAYCGWPFAINAMKVCTEVLG